MARRTLPSALGLGLGLIVLLGSPEQARAEKAVAKVWLHSMGMATRHQDASLDVAWAQGEPDMLAGKDVRLADDGLLVGGGFGASLMIDGMRAGFGVTFFGVRDTDITHESLPTGYSLDAGRLWGESIELRLGREFHLGPLFPYIDMRLAFAIMAVNTELHGPVHGQLGNVAYNRISLGFGPVAGVFVPLGDAFVDVSGYAGIFGDEKYGGIAAIGTWFDL